MSPPAPGEEPHETSIVEWVMGCVFVCVVFVSLAFGCDAATPAVCSPSPRETGTSETAAAEKRALETVRVHSAGFARYDALGVSIKVLLEVRTVYGLTELDTAIRELSHLMCKRFGSYVQAKIDSEPVERLYPFALLPLCDEIGCVSCRLRGGVLIAGSGFPDGAPMPESQDR